MKLTLSTFVLALAMLLSVSSAAMASDWITFKSDPGRFSVLMPGPGEPKAEVNTTTEPAMGSYTTYLYSQPSQNGLFLVGYVDYAPTFKFDNQAELEANRDNFVKGITGAKIVSTGPIKMGANPGLEFTAETDGAVIKSRVFIVGRRPYMLIAVTQKGVDDSVNIEKFFASFKVTAPARSAAE